MAAVVRAKRLEWGWDDEFAAMVVGKLLRGARWIEPFDVDAASSVGHVWSFDELFEAVLRLTLVA